MRALIAVTASVLLLAACGATGVTQTGPRPTQSDGTSATHAGKISELQATERGRADLAFTGKTLAGKAFSGESLAGKPAVLWFWAPWCSTCRAQAPNVADLGAKYRGKVAIVGVAGLATEQEIAEVAPTIGNITHLVDVESKIWRHFGVQEQSTYTVINADGMIVSEGFLNDEKLNRLVAQLAQQGA